VRVVVQRVDQARVVIDDREAAAVGSGLMCLLGVAEGDTEEDAAFVARKLIGLRLFGDEEGRMNLSVLELDPPGSILVVPNFTVCGDTRKGRRPSYAKAAEPERGNALFEKVCDLIEEAGVKVGRGEFGAHMHCELTNDGPVTVIVDSNRGPADSGS
jgi:D-tyrosyl-tRNA(Tyr) deacylase